MRSVPIPTDLRIALLYALFGISWIIVSDSLLAAFLRDPMVLTQFQTYKGWGFVVLSAVLIYSLVRHSLASLQRSERQLRESEERYRQLFEHSMDAILVSSPDGDIFAANPAACQMFRCNRDDITRMGRSGLVDTRDPRFTAALHERARTGQFFGELTFLRHDGTMFPGEISTMLFQQSDGMTRSSMIIRDMSERKRAEAELQLKNRMLTEAETIERRNLSRELHDRVGQTLTALNINLTILQNQVSFDMLPTVGARISDSMELVAQTMAHVRDVMVDLYPPVLADYGLAAALRWYSEQFTRRTELAVELDAVGDTVLRIPFHVEAVLFRVAQESLNNVARHAQAHHVHLQLLIQATHVRLTILDDGCGFVYTPTMMLPNHTHGWGLRTMKDRMEAIGGRLTIESSPNEGTTISADIEVSATAHDDSP